MNKRGKQIVLEKDFPRIIAFSGKFGTGKDGAANMLMKHFERIGLAEAQHLKFADAIKISSAEMTGMLLEDQYSPAGKTKEIPGLDMTIGRFQQLLGTVARVHIHPDIWILPVINKIKNSTKFTVISDCRFINEAIEIQNIGGIVIRLNRKNELISEETKAGRDTMHISETCLDDYPDFDYVVQNDGNDHEYLDVIMSFLKSFNAKTQINPDKISCEYLESFGFVVWEKFQNGDTLMLCPLETLNKIPFGTVLTNIVMKNVTFHETHNEEIVDGKPNPYYINKDCRFGILVKKN